MGIYSPIVTNSGSAAIASARASGGVIKYAQFAVGDSNGVYYAPSASQTALVHEVWRGNINPVDVYVHPNNPNWLVVAAHIPVTDGGFDIREAAVFSDSGVMIAVSRYPLTTKPAYGSGSEKDILVKMIMEVTNAAEVTQFVDPSLIFTTKEYVDSRFHFVRLAATANISSMAGTQTIDGVDAAIGDRILITAQTTGSQNGIYVVSSGAWTRALDFNSNENIVPSTLITVAEGNTYKDTLWMLASDSVTVGTTAITFSCLFPDNRERTISDSLVPASNTAPLLTLLNGIANRIKTITGGASWRDNPALTIVDTKAHIDAANPHTGSLGKSENAVSASKWATARTISFTGDATGAGSMDGSGNVSIALTVADDSHNHVIANVDGLQTALDGKLGSTQNAVSASKWSTARTLTFTGDATGAGSVDGSGNVSIALTVADDSHNHVIANVDGLQTALDAKANIASPSFTGYPTAPTQSSSDNSTRLATTAWVRNAMATIATAMGFAFVTGNSGYIKLPSYLGGLLLAWGDYWLSVTPSSSSSITFPVAMPNGIIGAWTAVYLGADNMIGYNSLSKTGFTIVKGINDYTERTGRWFAIGY